jgi:23S rRNA (pseudouridine1915-N3)-methyltransferase
VRLTVHAVARGREPWVAAAEDEYLKRLQGLAPLRVVLHRPASRGADPARARADEAPRLLGGLGERDRLVLLDARGRSFGSEAFAAWLGERQQDVAGELRFAIGGADGFGEAVIARADENLSLSTMTLPHELARVLLLEQLYRALMIRAGRAYHK